MTDPQMSGKAVVVLSLVIVLTIPSLAPPPAGVHGQSPLQASPAASPARVPYQHCNTTGTSVSTALPSTPGDIVIAKGQSLIISHQNLDLGTRNFVLNGGNVVIQSSKISGYHSAWQVQRDGCFEITDSYDDVYADSINLGGQPPPLQSSPDNSSLFVNHSTMFPGIEITGRDVTLRVVDSVFEDNIFFNGWSATWPVESSETRAYVSSSVVPTIALAFSGPDQGARIAGLHAGHFGTWNLHQNLTVTNLPYDLTLDNVTLIPNPGQEGNLLGGGWGLQFLPGGPAGTLWPSVKVTNSVIGELAFYWGCCVTSATFSNLGLRYPVTETLFRTISFVNTTVVGFEDFGCSNCNLTFNNVRGLGLFPNGKSSVTLVDSWTDDSFQPENCVCSATFKGNSSLGLAKPIPFTSLPYYDKLPDASWWQSLIGASLFSDSRLTITGNYTDNLMSPGERLHGFPFSWSNSSATRFYPVKVTDSSGRAVGGARVVLSSGGRTIREETTSSNGGAEVPIEFEDGNLTSTLTLSASFNRTSAMTSVGFATGTPLVLQLAPATGITSPEGYLGLAAFAVVVIAWLAILVRRRSR